MTPNQATDSTKPSEREELIERLNFLAEYDPAASDIASETFRKAAALLAADAQAGGEVDRRLKVKLGSQYGRCLAGHWFYLQPADELADAALARHTGTESHPHPQAVAQGWIPVNQQMPKSGRIVLALQKWDHSGKLGVIRAAWIAAKTEESSPESGIGEYDEATDTYYDPEGWYEQMSHWGEYSACAVNGAHVTHWRPLPPAPKEQEPVA